MIKSKTKNSGIIEAIKELKEISLTDRLRYEYEMRLKEKRDREAVEEYLYDQGMEKGREDGIKIGREDGIKDERENSIKAIINSMRSIKADDEQIVSALMTEYGLSRKEAEEKVKIDIFKDV